MTIYDERLLSLATFLESLPPERFNFTQWVGKGYVPGPECNTTACAIGWAAHMPEFHALGLRLHSHNPAANAPYYPCLDGSNLSGDWDGAVEAIGDIFGLDAEQVDYLFTPKGHDYDPRLPDTATPRDVAARIREFVES